MFDSETEGFEPRWLRENPKNNQKRHGRKVSGGARSLTPCSSVVSVAPNPGEVLKNARLLDYKDMKKRCVTTRIATFAVALLLPVTVLGQAIVTDVIDAADENDPFDANIQLRFEMDQISGTIHREYPCFKGSAECPNGSAILPKRELAFEQKIQKLVINPKIGLYKDLEVGVDIPVILLDQTKLSFAEGVTAETSSVAPPSTVDGGSFSLIQVGEGAPYVGESRSGLGDIDLKLRYAPFNYERDETEPTWVLAVRYTLPTGKIRKGDNVAVGQGVHALDLSTTISRRTFSWLEPYFSFHGTFRFPEAGSLFVGQGTQTLQQPGNILGIMLGTEFIPWEEAGGDDPLRSARLEIDMGVSADFVFEGREYTPLFEGLANSPCSQNPSCLLTASTRDIRDTTFSGEPGRTDGITDVEQYGVLAGWFGLHYQPVRYVQLGAVFGYERETSHFLTNADPGKDLSGDGPVTEAAVVAGETVNEFSPTYIEAIDAPAGQNGQDGLTASSPTRFRQEDYNNFNLMLHLTTKF